MPKFSAKSEERLEQAEKQLRDLFNIIVGKYDCTILQGHRNEATQTEYYQSGKSKVQWPNSKHNSMPSRAVDAAPYPIPKKWGAEHWKDRVKFYEFAAIVRYEASCLGIKIRWGGDWDSDGDYRDQTFDDLVHFELVEDTNNGNS